MNNNSLELLTIDEVAEELRIGKNAAYDLVRTGKIKAMKNGRVWKVTRLAIEQYITSTSGITSPSPFQRYK